MYAEITLSISVIFNQKASLTKEVSINFQVDASPYALCNMKV